MTALRHLLLPALILTAQSLPGAAPSKTINPDFTKGEKIPEKASHDWTLGATGARGWIYSNNLSTSEARQIAITQVATGSPADGVLKVGDVILGVAGKPFSYDPRPEFGKALTLAESTAGAGKLQLTRWRESQTEQVIITLPVLGDYSATAPFDCPKSKRILEQGCEALARKVALPNYSQNPISRSLNALALLASGNPKYLPLVKKEALWASNFSDKGMQTWYYGYVISLLAEYQIATGDNSFQAGLQRLALSAAQGQSGVGSWGHKFANPDGTLAGYGMMNAPGLPLTTSLVLARAAGLKAPEIELAIERSAKFLRFYNGKGSIPYGDHPAWIQNHDDNGKNGMAAVLFNLLDEPKAAEYFSRMALACHGAERDCGHTGNFWNITWAMPGVVQSGPQAAGAWMQEFGGWYFDLARGWDGTFLHQGPPEPEGDHTKGWDATGAELLAYAMPLKKIWLTGKHPSKVRKLTAAQAKQIVVDGRGWANNDRYATYDAMSAAVLLEKLASWSPVVRDRAAIAIARRKSVSVAQLLPLLDSPTLNARLGACEALTGLREAAAPAVPQLRALLRHEDLWLRIQAAETLAAIGQAATVAVPELLTMLTKVDPVADPRGMQQRYLAMALFNGRGGLVTRSLEGVDRDLLNRAIQTGLQNQDGHVRSTISALYEKLSYDEIKPLLPAILDAVAAPAPSNGMFADGVRIDGLRILASNHIQEGLQASLDYVRNQNPWGSEKRIPTILAILTSYGTAAKPLIPELERFATSLDGGEPDYPKHLSVQKAAAVREAIRTIETSDKTPTLISIKAPATKQPGAL